MNTFDATTKKRFDELLPWYVTGQLDEADRAWVEKVAAEHPAAGAELEWHKWLHREIQAKYASIPEDVGLDSLLARVRAEKNMAQKASLPVVGWGERMREFLATLAMRPAYALGTAVIVLQAGIIGALLLHTAPEPEYAETRAIAPGPLQDTPVLQVVFKADATERNMRLLLVRVAGRVVDGPSQLGDYIVAVPQPRIEIAKKEMEASGLVEAVTVLNKRPARE